MSLTRVGASRQSLTKTLAVTGADVHHVLGSVALPAPPPHLPAARIAADDRTPGLLGVSVDAAWLGTPAARDDLFPYLGAVFAALAHGAHALGGVLHPPGTRLAPGQQPPLGGDTHELLTLDTVEQEVLANLLRRHSPVLIALGGHGLVGGGPDRVGSRRLADSREHLAARHLASADPRHLHRVRAEIRRRDGIADLTRMDIAPVGDTDGTTPRVLVRCLDSQPSLADLRAHALLLAALALHARRMVRNGSREGGTPQRLVEENRARAVIHGLRARFVPSGGTRGRTGEPVPAREAARRLLDDLLPELSLLDATAEELFPLLAPLELPGLGLPPQRSQDLLVRAARDGRAALVDVIGRHLTDTRPGGLLLRSVREESPGRVDLLLDTWQAALTEGVSPRAAGTAAGPQATRPHDGRPGDDKARDDRARGRRPRDGGQGGGGRTGTGSRSGGQGGSGQGGSGGQRADGQERPGQERPGQQGGGRPRGERRPGGGPRQGDRRSGRPPREGDT
ncbi:hypothetical protein [Kitasatospora sp. NE20-6]|uniref:hypothetical protein n=1 Tax=Kitasatospora sp. NE20-6 TaxID=2859066 RepID=UPI0038B2CCAB